MTPGFCERTNLVAIILCLALICAVDLQAQNTADIIGTVTDSTGAVVLGATVTLTNVGTGIAQTAKSASTGDYSFPLVQVGTYTVKVEAASFKTFVTQVTVAAGDRARVDARLQVGSVTEKTEVSAVAPALQTDSSTVSSLITEQATQDLPLNGRNIVKLVQLLPGVNQGDPGAINSGNRPDDRRLVSGFSANGQGSNLNMNLIDGLDNNDRIINVIGVRTSMDAIQEVNVSTNLYTADLTRTAGAVVDQITKSGSNDFHGSAYEFFRNKVLNADPNYFNPGLPNPVFRQNQYGASIGGPIVKNKTFFFGDFENFRQTLGLSITDTVPTLYEEQHPGDFTDIGGPVLSPSQITPLGLTFFKMFPAPNKTPANAGAPGFSTSQATAPVSNYGYDPTRTQGMTTFDIRVDHHLANNDSLFARYSYNDSTTMTPSGFPDVSLNGETFNPGVGPCYNCPDAFPGPAYERQQHLGLSYTHVVSPTLLLNFKFAYMRNAIQSLGINDKPVANKLGFPCNDTSCINVPGLAISNGIPGLFFENSPYQNVGDSLWVPLLEFDNMFQYLGMATWTKGAQTIKIGVGLIRRQGSISQSGNPTAQDSARGRFDFSGDYTGYALADLLEGLASTMLRTASPLPPFRKTWEPSAYIQDDWRVKHWLTLNLGLRYDIFTPYTESSGHISNFDPAMGLLVGPTLPGAQQSSPSAGVRTNYNNIAPRVGFAASLPHEVVIRGGFGISYFPTNYESPFAMKNAPFNFNAACGIEAITTFGSCTAFQGGQFANSALATYYIPPTQPPAQTGGALFAAGAPIPSLDYGTATNKAGYAGQIIDAQPFHYPWAYLYQMNLMVQKEIKGNVLGIGWIGELGRHYVVEEEGAGFSLSQPANYLAPNPLVAAGFPWLASTSVSEFGPYGTSSYNALNATFVRRFRRGLTINAGYTWAHDLTSVDEMWESAPNACYPQFVKGVSYPCFIDNVLNPAQPFKYTSQKSFTWGNADIDIRQRLTYMVDYDLPFGKSLTGVEGQLVKGWTVNLAGFWQTGLPFTVGNAVPQNGIPGAGDLPDMICSGRASNPSLTQWINPACFKLQTAGTFGYQHPNQLFGPHQRDLDFSVMKVFPLTERVRLQFRAEFFNLTNTPNFDTPAASGHSTFGVAGFGAITTLNTTSNPRQVQLALKLLF